MSIDNWTWKYLLGLKCQIKTNETIFQMYSSLIKCSCHRLGRRHLPSALRIAHLPSAHPALLADRSFHTSFALQLRKAPNSVSKIFVSTSFALQLRKAPNSVSKIRFNCYFFIMYKELGNSIKSKYLT